MQFNQTNEVIHRQKLASQLKWNGTLLREVRKISTVINKLEITKTTWKQEKLWWLDEVWKVLNQKRHSDGTTQHCKNYHKKTTQH